MTQTKHTPGPWTVTTIKGQRFIWKDGTVATIPPLNRFPQQAEANARLVAAAPEEHAALIALAEAIVFERQWLSDVVAARLQPKIDAAFAAIAKAEGGAK